MPIAFDAWDVPPRSLASTYPEPFATRMGGRVKRALGAQCGLRNFGVNFTTLEPGAISALRHSHQLQDEFIYILAGTPTLITNEGETPLGPGMCAGFPAGAGDAHHLVNRSEERVVYLEIGDRTPGDRVIYPDDDLRAEDRGGRWLFCHKNGDPYPV